MSRSVSSNGASARAIEPLLTEPTRRRLSDRQAETVDRLVVAATEELHEQAYEGLTVRNVARRAGVAPATAYTYFASKDHLVAEVFWRRLQALDPPHIDRRRTRAARVAAALADIALLVADEPALSAASSIAILGNDPDVAVLRERIGIAMRTRIVSALGPDSDEAVVTTLELLLTGALLRAGMGYLPYPELPALLLSTVDVVLGGQP